MDKTVYYLSRAQAELGHHVNVLSISSKESIQIPGVTVATFPSLSPPHFLNDRLKDILVWRSPFNLPRRLIRRLLELRPDVLHLHGIHTPQNVVLAQIARRAGIAYCVTLHGVLAAEAQQRHRWIKHFGALVERPYLNSAAFVHALSEVDANGMRAFKAQNRIVMVPNGIDPETVPPTSAPAAIRTRYPETRGKVVFLFVGRLDPLQKGLDLLLHGLAMARLSNAVLILAGPSWRNSRTLLRTLVDELGLRSQVIFSGPVFGADKADFLHDADVFVHTSRWEAATPFAVLEAAVARRPCLLTDVSDSTGALARHGAAVIVRPAPASIADALAELAAMSPDRRRAMGQQARCVVDNEFTWPPIAEALVAAYRAHAVRKNE